MSNMAFVNCKILFPVALLFGVATSFPEPGKWTKTLYKDGDIAGFAKTLYNKSSVQVHIAITCNSKEEKDVYITWVMRKSPCYQEYINVVDEQSQMQAYFREPTIGNRGYGYSTVRYQKSKKESIKCSKESSDINLNADLALAPWYTRNATFYEEVKAAAAQPTASSPATGRRKRGTAESTANTVEDSSASPETNESQEVTHGVVVTTPADGVYLFMIEISSPDHVEFNATVNVEMKTPYGYLSAADWPLLPFYGTMCVIYIIYGIVWLLLLACNWRDLLRVQFWIGAVILLGMLEKAVFFAEYESINTTGNSVRGAVIFAELVSCLKRTIARMLVIIVSLGFGIVKPRLGAMLHRVIGVGTLYFVLASIEGCMRAVRTNGDPSKNTMIAAVPLAVLDAAICWWIFTSLVQTTRTLRLRRNIVKLSLYRHFTNTLIFAVLASIIYMVWSMKQHRLQTCLTDWKELWVDEAFWHLLFSVILMVIMILWRPSVNNQRYAFSPLLDAADDDDEEEEHLNMSDAFDGMKMRNSGKNQSGAHTNRSSKSKAEEDLKWIEENIPSSVADAALPSLLDSDEEIMTTKFEMSKME